MQVVYLSYSVITQTKELWCVRVRKNSETFAFNFFYTNLSLQFIFIVLSIVVNSYSRRNMLNKHFPGHRCHCFFLSFLHYGGI